MVAIFLARVFARHLFCPAQRKPGRISRSRLGFFFCLTARVYSGHSFCHPHPSGKLPLPCRVGDFLSSQRAANKSHRTAARWLLFGRYSQSFRAGQAAFSPSARAGVPVKPSARTCVSVLHKREHQLAAPRRESLSPSTDGLRWESGTVGPKPA